MSRKFNRTSSSLSRRSGRSGRGAKPSQKTLAIVSVCAIILGIMITAHDYLQKHTVSTTAAQTALTESLAEVETLIPAYVKAADAADKSVSSETKQLSQEASKLTSGSLDDQSEAYLLVSSVFEQLNASGKIASLSEAETLQEAIDAAEDAAVAYNKEAQSLNQKVGKFPYVIISKIAGYTEFPIFNLTRE